MKKVFNWYQIKKKIGTSYLECFDAELWDFGLIKHTL